MRYMLSRSRARRRSPSAQRQRSKHAAAASCSTIQRLMAETNVTYRALAEKTGLSAGYLNHLVHGNRPVPSDDVIAELAQALGVEPEHFREVRVRRISEKLERMPELID